VRPVGSIARTAFRDSLELLGRYRPRDPARRPAIEFTLAAGSEPAACPVVPGGEAGAPEGTIAAAAQAIAAGRLRCSDLLDRSLAACEAHNADLGAMVEVTAGSAREQAIALDAELTAGHLRGPLHGIPVTVKDVIDVAGVPTRAGSLAYMRVAAEDAVAVARLRRAGAVILGKATTHEFALGVTTPQSRNPRDPSRIPGGSSGGSAVAVATGIGLGSLGTDTRASLRVPAALSGVVGFKPTYGAVPTGGVVPLSWTMDHVGPIASTVGDAAILLDALIGHGPRLAGYAGAAVRGLRVGVPAAAFAGAEPAVEAAVLEELRTLADLGCVLSESPLPSADDLGDANAAGLVVSRCEAACFHRSLGADRSLYWQEVSEQLQEAEGIRAVDYLDAQRLRADLVQRLLPAFEAHDLLAMPTALVVAPRRDDFARFLVLLSRNAIIWSFTGFPALSMPCRLSRPGLPVGLQLIAAPGQEAVLVALGSALEHLEAAHRPCSLP
jgi:aspartyl-tRNA(Asn)/glutamyl-tRNA(Gln) amidotransferase subunit A